MPGVKSPVSLVFVDFLTYTCCMKKYIERIENLNPINIVRFRLASYQIGMALLTFVNMGYTYSNSDDGPYYFWLLISQGVIGAFFMAEAIKTIKSIKQKRPTN